MEEKKNEHRLKFCKWTTLRSFGDAWILKVSYIALLSVPMLANYLNKLDIEGFPLYLKFLFFSSLNISIGNILYSIFCPKLIKRFDTPNDMYRANLEIYKLRKESGIDDKFSGDYEHCIEGFQAHNHLNKFARFICFFCLIIGGLLVFALVLERSYWVISAK